MRPNVEEPSGGAPSAQVPQVPQVSQAAQVEALAPLHRNRHLTALALAARTQEPHAVRAFLQAAVPLVRGVCRGVLGAGHVELDDTIQECLIKLIAALPQYRAEGPASHYTQQIALHCAIATRKRSRTREQRLRVLAEEINGHPFDVHAESLPSLRLVRDVVDDLPAVQAETILMRTILGFSFDEIALATKVSINTVKSRLRVAKESLRRRLERQLSSSEEKS